MKRVLLYLGMGSCVSSGDDQIKSEGPNSSIKVIKLSSVSSAKSITDEKPPSSDLPKTPISVQTPVSEARGTKDEMFFDSKAWLESDDDDFVSVNGESSPERQVIDSGDHQGRKLSELFLESSFGSDSQTSHKASAKSIDSNKDDNPATTMKLKRKKSAQRCLPSLVRSLSCGDRKKRLSNAHIAAAVA